MELGWRKLCFIDPGFFLCHPSSPLPSAASPSCPHLLFIRSRKERSIGYLPRPCPFLADSLASHHRPPAERDHVLMSITHAIFYSRDANHRLRHHVMSSSCIKFAAIPKWELLHLGVRDFPNDGKLYSTDVRPCKIRSHPDNLIGSDSLRRRTYHRIGISIQQSRSLSYANDRRPRERMISFLLSRRHAINPSSSLFAHVAGSTGWPHTCARAQCDSEAIERTFPLEPRWPI